MEPKIIVNIILILLAAGLPGGPRSSPTVIGWVQ
jgi:hypothetical protein